MANITLHDKDLAELSEHGFPPVTSLYSHVCQYVLIKWD
jgi:hypothetical protein